MKSTLTVLAVSLLVPLFAQANWPSRLTCKGSSGTIVISIPSQKISGSAIAGTMTVDGRPSPMMITQMTDENLTVMGLMSGIGCVLEKTTKILGNCGIVASGKETPVICQ